MVDLDQTVWVDGTPVCIDSELLEAIRAHAERIKGKVFTTWISEPDSKNNNPGSDKWWRRQVMRLVSGKDPEVFEYIFAQATDGQRDGYEAAKLAYDNAKTEFENREISGDPDSDDDDTEVQHRKTVLRATLTAIAKEAGPKQTRRRQQGTPGTPGGVYKRPRLFYSFDTDPPSAGKKFKALNFEDADAGPWDNSTKWYRRPRAPPRAPTLTPRPARYMTASLKASDGTVATVFRIVGAEKGDGPNERHHTMDPFIAPLGVGDKPAEWVPELEHFRDTATGRIATPVAAPPAPPGGKHSLKLWLEHTRASTAWMDPADALASI